jgi:hypothetical protein
MLDRVCDEPRQWSHGGHKGPLQDAFNLSVRAGASLHLLAGNFKQDAEFQTYTPVKLAALRTLHIKV